MMQRFAAALLGTAVLVGTPTARAQQTGEPLTAGTEAPDFALIGSTRYGVLEDRIQLGDFRGETVVLAFFFRVRTPG